MVVLVEPRQEPHLHVVQRFQTSTMVEALLLQCAPETLHLAARLWIVGLGVEKTHAEAATKRRQGLAYVGRSIVRVHAVWQAVPAEGLRRQGEHLALPLRAAGLQRHHVPA